MSVSVVRLFVLLIALPLLGAAAGNAAQATIGIAPPRVEHLVGPGAMVRDAILVTNPGDVTLRVRVEVADFSVEEDGTVVQLPPGGDPSSLARYLRVSPLEMSVSPGQRAVFRYEVKAPEQFTHLRALLSFVSEPEVPANGGPYVVIATTMRIPFYVENRRMASGVLHVLQAQVDRGDDNDQLLHLELKVVNQGDRLVRAGGRLEVQPVDGGPMDTFEVNRAGEAVLPGLTRVWSFTVGPVPPESLIVGLRLETSWRSEHRSRHLVSAVPASGD